MTDQSIVLISGANRGIGREAARQLAAAGHFVILGSRDPSAGEREAGQIEAEGGEVSVVELDVSSQESVDRAAADLARDPGRLDVLINNAGVVGGYEGVADSDLEQAHATLETNLFGAWRLTQAVLPLLRESGHGRIVNVSSGMGQLSDMNGAAAGYRISKTGLNALTRILAAEEGGAGILANSVCPGWVRTDLGGDSARLPVEEGVDTVVWLATLPDDGPQGGFFRERKPIPW